MYNIEEFDKEKSKVMNYVMYKKRTEYEVKNKFKNTIQNDLLCDIIAYIKDAGYIDDTNYIDRAVQECIALKNISIKEMAYKLYNKGIDRDKIENYIYQNKDKLIEYEFKSAFNILKKKQITMDKEDIKLYLIKKGYKQETIKEVF